MRVGMIDYICVKFIWKMRHCVTMVYFNQNVPNFQRFRFFSLFKGITYVRTYEESEIGENQLSLDNYVKGYKDIQKQVIQHRIEKVDSYTKVIKRIWQPLKVTKQIFWAYLLYNCVGISHVHKNMKLHKYCSLIITSI